MSANLAETIQTELEFRPSGEEHRRFPRVIIDMPGRLCVGGERLIPIHVHDVSPDSLQIRCSPGEGRSLGSCVGTHADLVNIWLHLPFQIGPLDLKADCTIMHATVLEGGDYALGLKFESFDHIGERVLRIFIDEAMRPMDC